MIEPAYTLLQFTKAGHDPLRRRLEAVVVAVPIVKVPDKDENQTWKVHDPAENTDGFV